MWYIHTVEYYSTFKKKEILSFMTWMNLEGIMPHEIIQTQKDKYNVVSVISENGKVKLTAVRVEWWLGKQRRGVGRC
jgi:hypothetical protein